MEHGTLLNTLESCVRYWLETIKSDDERKQLRDYVRKMEAGHTSPFEEDSDQELVSSKKVEKMIEKSKQNQEEFESEEENGTFKSKTKRHPDFENASNNANEAAMERGDTRDPAREAEDGNDVEKENKLLENEEMKEKLQNQAMEVGEKRNSSKEAADSNDDEKEKRDSEILLKKEEEMMKMQNQAMEVDSGEDAQLNVMDTSGTVNEASLLTSHSTTV